jgi:hypothetical protein
VGVGPFLASLSLKTFNFQVKSGKADVIWFPAYESVNKGHTAILTVLNTTTRFAVARPLKSNKGESVAPAMESILEELRKSRPKKLVHTLRLDGGSEIKGATIEHVEPFTHAMLARTDRFHRTLRERLGEHFERTKSHVWINVLEDVVSNINDTSHTTLSRVIGQEVTPSTITAAQQKLVRAEEYHGADMARAHTNSLDIQTRKTRVRVLFAKTKAGIMSNGKAHHNVSTQESYLVLDREGPNSWIIDVPKGEVKVWASHSIQIAPDDERVSTVKSTKTVAPIVKHNVWRN